MPNRALVALSYGTTRLPPIPTEQVWSAHPEPDRGAWTSRPTRHDEQIVSSVRSKLVDISGSGALARDSWPEAVGDEQAPDLGGLRPLLHAANATACRSG
jgi:hypothetical protein